MCFTAPSAPSVSSCQFRSCCSGLDASQRMSALLCFPCAPHREQAQAKEEFALWYSVKDSTTSKEWRPQHSEP